MSFTQNDLTKLLQERDAQRQELLEQCRQGDRRAFNQFVQRYQDAVYSHVLYMTDSASALAITRDVFVTAYKSFKDVRDAASVEEWLFRLAEKRIASTVRRTGAKRVADMRRAERSETTDEWLLAYMDGELEDDEITRVEQRLDYDQAYRRAYEQLQQVDAIMRIVGKTSAPAELRVDINAKLDEKTVWQKILAAIEIFRHSAPERRLVKNAQIAFALGSVFVVFLGAWLYQFQQLQIYRATLHDLQVRVQRSGRPVSDLSQIPTSFVILTGNLTLQEISLEDARKIATLIAEIAEEQEPLWMSGGIEAVKARLQARIAPLFWNRKEERRYQKGAFIIHEISLELPENTVREFSLAIQRLDEKSGATFIAEVPTLSVTIAIIDKP